MIRCGWVVGLALGWAGVVTAMVQVETPARTTQTVRSGVAPSADQASEWGLTRADWARYQALMAGRRGIWSPGLDPLTALGVEAETEGERRRYAELWARAEYARVQRELAFERAKTEAFARLFPAVRPVDYTPAPRGMAALQGAGPHRLLAFVDRECAGDCRSQLRRLCDLSQGHPVSLDVYVVGFTGDDAGLRRWAQKVLPDAALRSGQVTLNHEAGALARLQLAHERLPLILVRTADNVLSPFRG